MSRARWIEHRCLPKFQRINAKTSQINLQCRKKRNMSLYFLWTPVIMMPKLHRDKRRENCRPISFIKMSAKFLNKIYRNWIKEHTQYIYYTRWSSRLHSRVAGMVQLLWINKCNPTHEKNERQKTHGDLIKWR